MSTKPKVLNFLPALPTTKDEFENEVCKRARLIIKRRSICTNQFKDPYYWNIYSGCKTDEEKDTTIHYAAKAVADETRLWDGF